MSKTAAAKAGADPRVGRRLGRWLLIGVLGRGGMGVVYRARSIDNDKVQAAVKLLPAESAADNEARRRFLHEGRSAARVRHANIVSVLEVGRDGDDHYLVTELVEGGNAKEFLDARGAFNWPEATRVVAEVCRGLAAVHATGVLHRDIKPANIMRSFDGVVKLADFGLAKTLGEPGSGSLTQAGALVGTPHYMSPEQCRSEPPDARSDVYALGATYYALLAGKPPYHRAREPLQILYGHCHEPVPDPRDAALDEDSGVKKSAIAGIPAGIVAIVQRAMAKKREDRYSGADHMLADLEAVLADPSSAAEEAGGWSEFQRAADRLKPARRAGASRPWLAPAIAAAVVLAVGAAMASRFVGRPSGSTVKDGSNDPVVNTKDPPIEKKDPEPIVTPVEPKTKVEPAAPKVIARPLDDNLVFFVAFQPRGRLLLITGQRGQAALYDLDRDTLRNMVQRHGNWIDGAGFTPDGRAVIAGARDRWLRRCAIDAGADEPLAEAPRQILFTAISPVGTAAATVDLDYAVRVWDWSVGGGAPVDLNTRGEGLAFSDDGRLLAVGAVGGVEIWGLGSNTRLRKLDWPGVGRIRFVAFSASGRQVIAAGPNRTARLWDIEGGDPKLVVTAPAGLSCAALTRDGRHLFTAGQDQIRIWETAGGREVGALTGHAGGVRWLALSGDGLRLASAGEDKTVRVWDVSAHAGGRN